MKNIVKNIMLWSAAALVLFSCAKTEINDPNTLPAEEYPILLSGHEAETKAKEILNVERTVGVHILDVTTGIPVKIFEGESYKARVTGASGQIVGDLTINNATKQPYWKSTYQKLNIYAYSPAGNFKISSVDADQSKSLSTPVNKNDMLFAKLKNKSFADRTSLEMPFQHRLSSIIVNLKTAAGDLITPTDGSLKIVNTYTKADFDYVKDEFSNFIEKKSIIPWNDGSNKYGAIIMPQEVFTEYNLFEITYKGTTYYARLGGATPKFEFEGGKQYTFNLTIAEVVSLTYEVNDWLTTTEVVGDAEQSAQYKLFDYFPDPTWTTTSLGPEPLGIVVEINSLGTSGKVLSTFEFNEKWSTESVHLNTMDLNGLKNSNIVLEYMNNNTKQTSYPLFVKLQNQRTLTGMNWYLPNQYELIKIFSNINNGSALDRNKLITNLTALSTGTLVGKTFWNSSESDASRAVTTKVVASFATVTTWETKNSNYSVRFFYNF